jgi:hypothetical protein
MYRRLNFPKSSWRTTDLERLNAGTAKVEHNVNHTSLCVQLRQSNSFSCDVVPTIIRSRVEQGVAQVRLRTSPTA